ncbi:PLP-dependent transferase [Hesseltinella vesiculosa]|uniref:cystathionine gamma-synthase n=1 Tax=Hesseltinella vesiculosa TaxID=101127 RepID=A0A1X2GAF6_9FUNG|nr:PLP-dependent transferase [Hesseltinella vesiculosa]
MPLVPTPPIEVGSAIPAHTPHAVSVTLPTWEANIGYEEGDTKVTSKMECGYPRFFIHPHIQKLCARLLQKFGKPSEKGMLFPSRNIAEKCRVFMKKYYTPAHERTGLVRIAECEVAPVDTASCELQPVSVYLVLFPADAFPVAKQYWQHAGDIVSSRLAEYCLRILDQNDAATNNSADAAPTAMLGPKKQGRYGRPTASGTATTAKPSASNQEDVDQQFFLEERYGRNLPVAFAGQAKRALRRRIAGVLTEAEEIHKALTSEQTTDADLEKQRGRTGQRGIKGLSENDVYLYPTGMSAIYHAHQIAMKVGDASRHSVCFGFPYTDTLKILQKFGPGCHFYGLGDDASLDELELLLASGESILSLFCEIPSNPLLKTPDIHRLRTLADKHGFLLVVDETIGNFCNVNVLEWADIAVSSLTKVFSGDSNVMGGSLVLNPNRRFYTALVEALKSDYEDVMWNEDAVFLERNSRDFRSRSKRINENTEALCEMLVKHPKVVGVYYPKYTCTEHYHKVKNIQGGYGGLFSVMLKNEQQASQFFDNLNCAKGPSLGTNFTLASPYTILAHYTELDWAKQFGVERHLVRVSVGLEEHDRLLAMFESALNSVQDNE